MLKSLTAKTFKICEHGKIWS